MKLNQAGVDLIHKWEGCELTAYQDCVGVWTIGWGHTGPDVYPGLVITQDDADDLFLEDVAPCCDGVKNLVRVPLTDNQFSALVSFTYNLGVNALRISTLLRKLNLSDFQGAADEFPKWDMAGGHVVKGLLDRRKDEEKLFLTA